MNFTVSKEEINKALSLINTIVEKKTTMPIMANVLISAEDGYVRFSGSDLDIGSQAKPENQLKNPSFLQ